MKEDTRFISAFYRELEKKGISFCILRNADEVKSGDAHDIDMAVDSQNLEKMNDTLISVANRMGWKMHLKTGSTSDKINIKCYHFFKDCEAEQRVNIVHFDVFPTFTWNGYVLLDNNCLMQNIDASNLYHRADQSVEAVTKLFVRLLYSNYIKEKYRPFIQKVCAERPQEVLQTLRKFLDESVSEFVLRNAQNSKWESIEKRREDIIENIREYAQDKRIEQKKYLVKKALNKVGVMVAFEGTDGSGKSTIIGKLPGILGNSFPDGYIDYYHWRPGVIKKEKKLSEGKVVVVTEPHAKKPYGKIKSLAKFMFINLDYILGYWYKVRWQIAKGHLVIFDRYYYDYYLDKLRYRLNISDKFLDFFKGFIPMPDVTFLLIGDAQTLYERKREISIEEIQSQTDRLVFSSQKFSNAVSIDVNKSVDEVSYQVSKEILNVCSKKYMENRL